MNPSAFASLPSSACQLGPQGSFGPDRITRNVYDAASQIRVVQRAYGTTVQANESTTYRPNGTPETIADGNGNLTTYAYDGFDRRTRIFYPGKSNGAVSSSSDYEAFVHDEAGNIREHRLRDGQWLYHTYDALNRRTHDTNPKTNIAETDIDYGYDNFGHLTSASDGNGWTAGFQYNALGHVVQQSSNLSSNTLQYDPAGRLTRQTWADGFFATYDYFVTGEVSDICENGTCASGAFKLASFGYDNVGRRTSIARGNGTSTSYGHDPASRLDALSHNLAGASADIVRTFGRNPAGQITTRTSTNDSYAWTSPASESRSYAVNGLNQYTQAGSAAPTYDARGNLTSMGATVWQYNSRNRLYQDNAGNSFYHGPLGQLNQAEGHSFDYLGDKLVTELIGNQIARRYVHSPGVSEALVWYDGAGTGARRWLHADERGSIVSLSDSSGNPIAINTYDTFGVPAASNQGRFQYTGQKWISALGMYDYKARVYAPTLGRFLQTDPIGYEDGLNLYAYAGNDPVSRFDPTGTSCEVALDDNNQPRAKACKIDEERDALVEKYGERAVAKLESSYKDAVNNLLEKGDATETITIALTGANGRYTGEVVYATVSAKLVAENLIKRIVGYDPKSTHIIQMTNESRIDIGSNVGQMLNFDPFNSRTWGDGLNTARMVAWTHEGMHTGKVHEQLGPRTIWENDHTQPFTWASYRLLFP